METWKQIRDFDYEINQEGVIRRISNKHIKKPFIRKDGYYQIQLMIVSKTYKMFQVHRLVAEAFIPNPENKLYINHIDNNRSNYSIDNLEWVTHSENMKHAYRVGNSNVKGSKNGFSKLKEEDVLFIRNTPLSLEELAKKFNVKKTTIKHIKYKHCWKHI